MNEGETGFLKYQQDKMRELLPEAKKEAEDRIIGALKPLIIKHEVKIDAANEKFSEKDALLKV